MILDVKSILLYIYIFLFMKSLECLDVKVFISVCLGDLETVKQLLCFHYGDSYLGMVTYGGGNTAFIAFNQGDCIDSLIA